MIITSVAEWSTFSGWSLHKYHNARPRLLITHSKTPNSYHNLDIRVGFTGTIIWSNPFSQGKPLTGNWDPVKLTHKTQGEVKPLVRMISSFYPQRIFLAFMEWIFPSELICFKIEAPLINALIGYCLNYRNSSSDINWNIWPGSPLANSCKLLILTS